MKLIPLFTCLVFLAMTHLTLSKNLKAQTKDRRAELSINGRVNEISVSPDERIWLVTAIGTTYTTAHMDSNWHYGTPLDGVDTSSFSTSNPFLERISFFNKDTALLTGYIASDRQQYKQNGYYRTTDGGRSWQLQNFGGNSWIYSITNDAIGHVWMGGASNEVYYSSDYGQQWTTLKMPYKSSDRTYGIWMSDQQHGIAGSDENEILITTDNWKTVKYVPTPFDQKKYVQSEAHEDSRIAKIQQWKNYYVVEQAGHIFYTDTLSIDWKPFPLKFINFETDAQSGKLYVVADSLCVYTFITPDNYLTLNKEPKAAYPIDLKVVAQSLYILTGNYNVYKVSEKGIVKSDLCTKDRKIAKPTLIRQHGRLHWGAGGRHLYLSDDDGKTWYRENIVDFGIADLKIVDDSTAILWDGSKNNYRYSLQQHRVEKWIPEKPLHDWLASPIISITIQSGNRGCFHYQSNDLTYYRKNDSTFTCKYINENGSESKSPSVFKNRVDVRILDKALHRINDIPMATPTISDFTITDSDKKKYFALVDTLLKNPPLDFTHKKKVINKEYYYGVAEKLDTVSNELIKTILEEPEGIISTSSSWFSIQIVNQKRDTLTISRDYYHQTKPWNLPWLISYNHLNFRCYDIGFSKFIKSCLPEYFLHFPVFDNSLMILEIADYLYNKEK